MKMDKEREREKGSMCVWNKKIAHPNKKICLFLRYAKFLLQKCRSFSFV